MAEGDLCVFRARLELGGEGGATEMLLASFHGDTNGLASTPVVSALRQQARLFSDGSQTVLRPPRARHSVLRSHVAVGPVLRSQAARRG